MNIEMDIQPERNVSAKATVLLLKRGVLLHPPRQSRSNRSFRGLCGAIYMLITEYERFTKQNRPSMA
jgi:hypothetical protein